MANEHIEKMMKEAEEEAKKAEELELAKTGLPIVIDEGNRYFFDERLNELRNIRTAERIPLDSGGVKAEYYKKFFKKDLKDVCNQLGKAEKDEDESVKFYEELAEKLRGFLFDFQLGDFYEISAQEGIHDLKKTMKFLGCKEEGK